jgi:two-component system, NarL family, invasion response regulator UvrY
LTWLRGGKGIKEIATVLEISPKTVSTYRTRLLRKLHYHSTADLIRYSFKHGIAE